MNNVGSSKSYALAEYQAEYDIFAEDIPGMRRQSFTESKKAKTFFVLDFKDVTLNFRSYFEFFLYYFLFYNFLGPFIWIFFQFTPQSRMVMKNMRLFRFNFDNMIQYIHWVANVAVISLFIREGFGVESVPVIYNLVFCSIFRCAIMAAKFATFGEEKMHQFRTRVVSSAELKSEQMLKNWKDQDDLTIFKSINQAIV